MEALVQHLIDAANRASVVLYSVDPRGIPVHALTAADNAQYSSPQQVAALPMQRSSATFFSRDGLVALAAGTGGLFLRDNNDLDGQVRQVVRDTEGYYLIGYHPDSSTFDRKSGQVLFHKVAVRVKRSGLQVRSRGGFFGAPDREAQGSPRGRENEILHALRSPFSASGIHVRLTPLFSNAEASGSYLKTLLHIDAKDLRFTDSADGGHRAVVDLVAMTFGESDQAVDQTATTYEIPLRGSAYEEALKNWLLYSVAFQVKTPGAYQMRVVVRDGTSGQLGSASQFIEVPDIESGRLTLSSITLREAPPKLAGVKAVASPQANEAVRVFQHTSPMQYSYRIFNAQTDSEKKPRVESQVRIFRDGGLIYTDKFDALPPGRVGRPETTGHGRDDLSWTDFCQETMCCKSW